MSTLSITGIVPAVPNIDCAVKPIVYGASVSVARCLVLNTATGKYSHGDITNAITSAVVGLSVNAGAIDTGGFLVSSGKIVLLGATMTVGLTYYLGAAGVLKNESDIATGEFVTRIGICIATGVLQVDIKALGIARG
jgi:hypothetical protein